MAATGFRITYATMSADDPELNEHYERAVEKVRREWLGQKHPFFVNGEERWGGDTHVERSPIDRDLVVGEFAQGTRQDVKDAVAAARAFFPEWSGMPWQERVAIMRRAAEVISERVFELAALMAVEVGKNRLEALGDVQETAELIEYYCDSMERNEGFSKPMSSLSESERNRDVLKPYGVWGVISPFNFPFALAGGPVGAALVTGNCVVLKPSNAGAAMGVKLYEALRDGGVPAGAFHTITGRGSEVGQEIQENPDVDGLTFTGSYEVGMGIYKNFARDFPKPAICEMGGKNPVVVSARADLDKAVEGVARSAFGFGGQKCSAASRVYVQREIYDEFVERLRARAEQIAVGDPLKRENWLGPVINEDAVQTYLRAAEEARASGRIVTGGEKVEDGDLARGNFVRPTVAEVPRDSWIWKEELFVPFVAVGPVDSMEEGIELANRTEYGLTAGFFSEDDAEVQRFLDGIHAGVVYVNRRAGATTGAWPGYQPFGGWKGSGTTGKAGGGDYYVQQYMREQSQTVIEE
ncbi:MAG: aldehyde dehydrogenase family protein [Actinobacteria bacterium]|nr:aldehyde dehydrogenase family protein [Actinomycetota bacterium]